MSHFTVLVCLDNLEEGEAEVRVAEMLAPYQENNMGDCPDEYLEFIPESPEYAIAYDSLVKEHEDVDTITEILPESFDKDTLKYSDFMTKEEFIDHTVQQLGYTYNEEQNAFGHYGNPNSKWDWYAIGGRWGGMLPYKDGAEDVLIASSYDSHLADGLRVKDLDMNTIKRGASAQAEEAWVKYQLLRKGEYNGYDAEQLTTALGLREPTAESKKAHEEHIAALRKDPDVRPLPTPPNMEFNFVEITKDEFIEKVTRYYHLSTFAVVDVEGQWHEKGAMGWFGVSSASKEDEDVWEAEFFDRFIHTLDPEDYIVIVDCHV